MLEEDRTIKHVFETQQVLINIHISESGLLNNDAAEEPDDTTDL